MKNALDIFGEEFIHSIFDRTMKIYGDMIFQKKIKGETAQFVDEQLSGFSDSQRRSVYSILHRAIEDTSCNMLDLFEQNEDLQLAININGAWIDLNKISDGLSGELFGDSGWIEKFSKTACENEFGSSN